MRSEVEAGKKRRVERREERGERAQAKKKMTPADCRWILVEAHSEVFTPAHRASKSAVVRRQ
jgi:hypothetical protein